MIPRLNKLQPQILKSSLDRSVNWTFPKGKGHLEARYVRRDLDHISAYVSSHNGCKMGCQMCFLTQLNQVWFNHATLEEYKQQFDKILDYYDQNNEQTAERVNVNFMARGEPLANKFVINAYPELYLQFEERALRSNLELKSNISTIMPHVMKGRKLSEILCGNTEIYYSLYSTNQEFRKKWLPNAIDYNEALPMLAEFQTVSNKPITFHWAFIKNCNDSVADVQELVRVLKPYNFFGKFNLVRYNPPPNLENTEEPSEDRLKELLELLKEAIYDPNEKSKIVPRVGQDVYASCGMFVNDLS